MPLLESEKNKLFNEYPNLFGLVMPNNQQFWVEKKGIIIDFCVKNDIYLYNIGSLKLVEASKLLNDLIKYIEEKDHGQGKTKFLLWKKEFNQKIEEARPGFICLHNSAYLSLADQYRKTKAVERKTLLTIRDISTLLGKLNFKSEDILLSPPFSLTGLSFDQANELKVLIRINHNSNKTIFLPVVHDGHWFYLLGNEGKWSLNDSQPLSEGRKLTDRQLSMINESTALLTELTGKNVELNFKTSEEQLNDYDCGTQVINAYRKEVNNDYNKLSHSEILWELLEEQLAEEEFHQVPKDLFEHTAATNYARLKEVNDELTAEETHIIDITSSSQLIEEKVQPYRDNLKELIQVIKKQGLFVAKENQIDITAIDFAEANPEIDKSDEDFAQRLQEAEFRKAGLS